MSYESPITLVEKLSENLREEIDNRIVEAVTHELSIKIDRNELTKALLYDRHQYEKGYQDGYLDGLNASKQNKKTGKDEEE